MVLQTEKVFEAYLICLAIIVIIAIIKIWKIWHE